MARTNVFPLHSFKYAFTSQFVSILFGIFSVLVFPLLLRVESYGYWQLYIFYASYVGIFFLGFNDGIYLRYGGMEYADLPFPHLRSAFRIHLLVVLFFMLITIGISWMFFSGIKFQVMLFVSSNIVLLGVYGVYIYVFQITNQIKRFSLFNILPKVVLLVFVGVGMLVLPVDLFSMMGMDLVAKVLTVGLMIYFGRALFVGANVSLSEAIAEYWANVSAGIKVMLSQFIGLLLVGVTRIIVEYMGDIQSYAYFSLAISLTNLLLVMATSFSMILYPGLKRVEQVNLPEHYNQIGKQIGRFALAVPLIYGLTIVFVDVFLVEYANVLEYLYLLFGVVLLQLRISILHNNFYYSLRQESILLRANLQLLAMFLIIAPLFYACTKNLIVLALSMLLVMFIRFVLAEIHFIRHLNIQSYRQLFTYGGTVLGFVLIAYVLGG